MKYCGLKFYVYCVVFFYFRFLNAHKKSLDNNRNIMHMRDFLIEFDAQQANCMLEDNNEVFDGFMNASEK